MPNPYQAIAESAQRTIAAKGQTMTLCRVAIVAYDPLNPETSLPTVEAFCKGAGVVLPANSSTVTLLALDNHLLSDPLLRKSFRYVILAGASLTFTPEAGDILITAEGPYKILGTTPLDPSGQGAILFNVGCTLDTTISLENLNNAIG